MKEGKVTYIVSRMQSSLIDWPISFNLHQNLILSIKQFLHGKNGHALYTCFVL